MDNFSIDVSAEQIVDARSREYFQEVLSSFANENYRSAVVVLWTVVVTDLIYKLQTLRDMYQDGIAKDILEKVEKKQNLNPTNPEWELFLLEEVSQRTKLLEAADSQNLRHLQKLRHLSAHPVLGSANALFAPNKETTRASLRNALEGLLLKSPMFSKDIVKHLVEDIAEKKALLPGIEDLKQYLDAKYFVNLHPSIEKELVKALWKFCFRLSNPDTDANREINTRCLQLLHQRDPAAFKKFIADNPDYFSEVAPAGPPLYYLTYFIAERPALYSALTDAAKVPLQNFVLTDANLLIAASFASPSFEDHVAKVADLPYAKLLEAKPEVWAHFVSRCNDEGLLPVALNLGSAIYNGSGSFNTADMTFGRFIEPYLSLYNATCLTNLLEGIEKNNQTYGRGRAAIDHPKVAARAAALAVNTAPFGSFLASFPP